MLDADDLLAVPIGEALIKQGELTREQVDYVLKLQQENDKRLFGEIAVDLGYIDLMTVIRYLEAEERED